MNYRLHGTDLLGFAQRYNGVGPGVIYTYCSHGGYFCGAVPREVNPLFVDFNVWIAMEIMSKRLASSVILGVFALTLSSCGTQAASSPTPTAAAESATSTASPSASDEPAGSIPDNFGVPAPAGKFISSPNGSYMQSTISDDDPAMELNPALIDPSANEYDAADLEEAQRTIVRFVAEEGIDSTLNGDNNDVDQWWENNKHKIATSYQSEAHQSLMDRGAFVLNEKWRDAEYGGKYDYQTSPKRTRIYDRYISPRVVWFPAPGSIAVEVEVSYNIPVIPGVGLTGTGIQSTSGTMSYGVIQDETGNWVINGFFHEVETVQG